MKETNDLLNNIDMYRMHSKIASVDITIILSGDNLIVSIYYFLEGEIQKKSCIKYNSVNVLMDISINMAWVLPRR